MVQIIAALPSKKAFGVVPQSKVPFSITPSAVVRPPDPSNAPLVEDGLRELVAGKIKKLYDPFGPCD